MLKRLRSWMGMKHGCQNHKPRLQDILQEVGAMRKTLRKQTALLEEMQEGLASIHQCEAQKEIEPLLACTDAFFHLDQSLRESAGFSAQHEQAVGIVWERMDALLAASGVAMIRDRSVPFDPRCHEAIEGGEGDKLTVLRVVQPGYRQQGRVIRAAKAIVGERMAE